MHRNYYLFEKQVQLLNKRLRTYRIVSCFTYRKNELIIHLRSEDELFLRIGLLAQSPYILTDNVRHIKDPRVFFFKILCEKSIDEIKIKPYDKLIYLHMDQYTLHCIFFGKEKNVLLINNDREIIETFKKSSKYEITNYRHSPELISSKEELLNIDRINISYTLGSFLTGKIGGFNKLLSDEVCFRTNLTPDLLVSEVRENDWKNLVKKVYKLLEEIKDKECYLYEHPEKPSILSLVKLRKISEEYQEKCYQDTNSAWQDYLEYDKKKNNLDKVLSRNRDKIKRRIDYLEKTLKKISNFEELEEKKKTSELKGHLLQTFSREIEKGAEQVKLKNIYSAKEEFVLIKLDPRLSTQENARKYFNKYKDIDSKKESFKSKRDTYQAELKYWKKMYHDSEKIDNLKKVEKLSQVLYKKKLIQKARPEKKSTSSLDISSFNRVLLGGNWEILIGKNAENNDLLTFKFSHKYDIWLHAQGVSGSHVVIRLPNKNAYPPKEIIEDAASIAAYFSSAKNSSTVPVNYTEVRYVRKPRKAPAGTAVITNSKTIFVEPKKFI